MKTNVLIHIIVFLNFNLIKANKIDKIDVTLKIEKDD